MAPSGGKSRGDGGSPAAAGASGKRKALAAAAAQDDDDSTLFVQRDRFDWMGSFVILCVARWVARNIASRLARVHQNGEKSNGDKTPSEGRRKVVKSEPELPLNEALALWAANFKIPLGLLAIFALTCAIIAGGEISNSSRDDRPREANDDYYGILGHCADEASLATWRRLT
mmetsp:Transcript_173930/g.557508  ORF Transcript_173930/g.557508 Transcript_173930/m.557508 type:complete len:172 (+) Transcript_173930:40-555(+)